MSPEERNEQKCAGTKGHLMGTKVSSQIESQGSPFLGECEFAITEET